MYQLFTNVTEEVTSKLTILFIPSVRKLVYLRQSFERVVLFDDLLQAV